MLTEETSRHWLNERRINVYVKIVLFTMSAMTLIKVGNSRALVDTQGKPIGTDFITFWAASLIGLHGDAQHAYNINFISHIEQLSVPGVTHDYAWFYPPTFYLFILPLALLPYAIAYLAFIIPTGYFYIRSLRTIIHGQTALLCIVAYPGIWINALHGQNGFLTAALAGTALLIMQRMPYMAGCLMGALVIKPQLAVLIPVALISGRQWKTLWASLFTGVTLMLAGYFVFGESTYKAFFSSLDLARSHMERGDLPLAKMPSWFSFARCIGLPISLAYGIHLTGSALACISVWRIWRSHTTWPTRNAALMAGTCLMSPFIYDYDLTWIGFSIAWIMSAHKHRVWSLLDREIIMVAWLLPLLLTPISKSLYLNIGPITLSALLAMICRHATREREPFSS